MALFDIGGAELLLLAVLGVLLFGPDKVPELARKTARVVRYLRGIANSATSQLKQELGPEFADLKATDLQPRNLVQKFLLNDIQDDLNDIKSELSDVRNELDMGAASAELAVTDVKELAAAGATTNSTSPAAQPSPAAATPFDPEAT